MRVVHTEAALMNSIHVTRSEAGAAFGDATVYMEKFLQNPRHVEVQILSDGLGNAIHLYDRDCSLPRRHQKVLEEAPAPGINEEADPPLMQLVSKPVSTLNIAAPAPSSFYMKTAASTL